MKLTFTQKHLLPDIQVLEVSGDLTTQWIDSLKDELIALQEMAMKKSSPFEIVISLRQVTSIDVAALQLLYVFRELMETINCPLTIASPELPPMMELIDKSGWSHVLVRATNNNTTKTK